MNRKQALLGQLAEECCELAKNALKGQRFGHDDDFMEISPELMMKDEYADIMVVIAMLYEEGIDLRPDTKVMGEKRAKRETFIEYSKKKGQIQ